MTRPGSGTCGPPTAWTVCNSASSKVLAAAGASFADRDHSWHLAQADRLVDADPSLFRTTRRMLVDTTDGHSRDAGVAWWEDLTGAGGEGMVVKPLANLTRTEPVNLDRLRDRNLGRKHLLALREYALVWKPSTAWWPVSRCGASTRRCSACSPSNPSRSIRGCEVRFP